MSEKTCTKCDVLKPIEQFVKDSRLRSGYSSICGECNKVLCRERYQANKVEYGLKAEQYYEANKDQISERQKRYWVENKERLNEQQREYYIANKERMNAQMAEYYERNREEIAAYQAEYRKANKERIAARAKERQQARDGYVKDVQSRIRKRAYRELKNDILEALGGKCYCCSESNIAFLTIDHINNDGQQDRKPNGKSRNSYMILRDIWKAGCPTDRYRVACYNCNCARHQTPDKVCPHQLHI